MSHLEESLAWQIKIAGLPEPKREFRFDGTRRYRFDFAWPEMKLAVEVEGGQWGRGRHLRPIGFAKDCSKYNLAAVRRWCVLRFVEGDVRDGTALAWVESAMEILGKEKLTGGETA